MLQDNIIPQVCCYGGFDEFLMFWVALIRPLCPSLAASLYWTVRRRPDCSREPRMRRRARWKRWECTSTRSARTAGRCCSAVCRAPQTWNQFWFWMRGKKKVTLHMFSSVASKVSVSFVCVSSNTTTFYPYYHVLTLMEHKRTPWHWQDHF